MSCAHARFIKRGLTLVEVLIAIGLIGLIAGATFMFWNHLDSGRARIRAHIDRRQAARVFLDRVERDLFSVIVADGQHGAGLTGNESSLSLLTRSVNMPDALRGGAGAYRDLQRVAYQFTEGSRTLTASIRSLIDNGATAAGPTAETIGDDFGLVRFRYHNGRSWSDSFYSQSTNRLPAAIEVAVWFDSPRAVDRAEEMMSSLDAVGNENGAFSSGGGGGREAPFMFDEDVAALSDELNDESNWPLPDRLRVIVVPDGPDFNTGRSYEDVVVTTGASPASPAGEGGTGE